MEDSHVKFMKINLLACSAYPLIEINPITLDQKCKFCKECGTADKNLNFETESLIKNKRKYANKCNMYLEICHWDWGTRR